MKKTPKVFVTYSWDNDEHQEWVTSFVNLLRGKGVDATSDIFETQIKTVNLNHMMVKNIKDSDYTILICTSNYAQRANEIQGGVGFETSMLMSVIQENMQKIIVILKGESKNAIPFYLRGVNYIDFSDEKNFADKFKEILHRILDIPLIEVEPLGEVPDLTPRKTKNLVSELQKAPFNDLIPNFKKHTDMDKNKFMNTSFIEIKESFIKILNNTKQQNSNFDFECDDFTTKKSIYKLYIDGNQIYSFKVWIGSGFGFGGPETINFHHGRYVTEADNSMNEIISCEVGSDNSLKLKMSMNMHGNIANTSSEIFTVLWKNILSYLN